MTMYHEITITPATGGFGEYDANICDIGEGYAEKDDLLAAVREIVGDIYQLGDPDTSADVADIRGRIHCEPTEVWGWDDAAGDTHYFGIAEI